MNSIFLANLSSFALRVQASIEFLDPSDHSIDIDFPWHAVLIIPLGNCLLDAVFIKLPIQFASNPSEPMLLQISLHLSYLLLQFLVLSLQLLHFLVLLRCILSEPFQKLVFGLQFFYGEVLILNSKTFTLS